MTKQITIKEDGVSKSESVDFINTQVAGGSANWMPEDESQRGVFYVYANGEYVPSEYGLYGFYIVSVMVRGGNGAETITHENQSPTYVTPLPATGLGASVIGVDPTDGAMYRTEIQDVDGVPTLVKTKVADSKADYKPTSMKILIKPAKLSYNAGDKIQYAGLVVQLLDSTGYTFVDERFPQGIISWSPVKNLLHPEYNLITPMEYAEASEVKEKELDGVIVRYSSGSSVTIDSSHTTGRMYYVTLGDGPFYKFGTKWFSYDETDIRYPDGGRGGYICSEEMFYCRSVSVYEDGTHSSGTQVTYQSYEREGKTAYYIGDSSFQPQVFPTVDAPINDIRDWDGGVPSGPSENVGIIAWAILYGNPIGSANGVKVQWKSPYDNQTYEDTFEIEVEDA